MLANAGLQLTVIVAGVPEKATLLFRIVLVSESGMAMQLRMPDGVPPLSGLTVIEVGARLVMVGSPKLLGASAIQIAV